MLLFSFYFLPTRPPSRSLSLHLLKSLSRRGAHQISIVDLLMLRSVLHRQRFHTQDEREMNTEDARGWHGALTTPATATLTASLHQAGIWEELRTRGWDCLLCNNGSSLRPKTAMHWLVVSDVKPLREACYWFLMQRRIKSRSAAALPCVWNPTKISMSQQAADRLFFPHVKSLPMLSVRLPAGRRTYKRSLRGFLGGHYWMNTETRPAVNGQFGYTAVRLELLGVMYRLSTCQLYKGGSRLCKCVCK